LIGECRELGDDAVRWREHMFQKLCRLVGADIGMGGEMGGYRAGRLRGIGTADWGWESGFDRAGWLRSLANFAQDPLAVPELTLYGSRLAEEDGVCLSRQDYIPDDEWYPSDQYQTCYSTAGVDRTLFCFRELPGAPDEFSGLLLSRAKGSRDYSGRDRAVVRDAHALLAPLVGGALARFSEPSPAALPPRVRQVLKCLLEGDGDKQVARRLGISPHTVNVHTKAIFRHFGVQSRAELLARWIRRGWGGRCAWADE
jgi:DNA-binding CsgD family transcriptional regulator